MPKKSGVRFTKVYPGGYRAIAHVSKAAGVLAVLMRFSDQVYNRFGYNRCTSTELRGGTPVSIPVYEICELTSLTERQVANAIATLKKCMVYNERGEALPLLEQLKPAHHGKTAVYALHVENELSTKPFSFFTEPRRATVVPAAMKTVEADAIPAPCVGNKATDIVNGATGMDDKGTWEVVGSYCDSGALLLGNQHPYEDKDMNRIIGDEQKLYVSVGRTIAYAKCPECGGTAIGRLDESGKFSGRCKECGFEGALPVPSGLKAVKRGDNFVFALPNT